MHPLALAGLLALGAVLPPTPDAGLFPAELVVDLANQTSPSYSYSWLPTDFVEGEGGVFYFFTDDGAHGRELWRSDGTALGTYLLRDICPGLCGADPRARVAPLASLGSRVYFAADDGVHGVELWITDGSALGTRMVRDIRAGARSSEPNHFVPFSGQVLFVADDGEHGAEVWRSDGTPAGTKLLSDVVADNGSGWIVGMIPGPGFLFVAVDSWVPEVAGLWRVEGIPTAPVRLGGGRMASLAFKGAPFLLLSDGRLLFKGLSVSTPSSGSPMARPLVRSSW